jgi:hypothetical protein
MIKVNGVDIATPKVFSVEINDIDGETERNANGDLIRDRIAVKQKLNMEWPPLTNLGNATLLQAVSGVFFDVTYPDPITGTNITKTMYVGARSASVLKIVSGQITWEGLKMSFIER